MGLGLGGLLSLSLVVVATSILDWCRENKGKCSVVVCCFGACG